MGFALLTAIVVLPGAKSAASPALYVIIFGGLSVGIPTAVGIAIVSGHVRDKRKRGPYEIRCLRATPIGAPFFGVRQPSCRFSYLNHFS
jgi:hypothetical protein